MVNVSGVELYHRGTKRGEQPSGPYRDLVYRQPKVVSGANRRLGRMSGHA